MSFLAVVTFRMLLYSNQSLRQVESGGGGKLLNEEGAFGPGSVGVIFYYLLLLQQIEKEITGGMI